MTDRSVTHATFTIERSYPATPARVFAAFADPAVKAIWTDSPEVGEAEGEEEFDFRVGGRERFANTMPPGGTTYRYDALYYDIVPDQRIIYCYEMYAGDARLSVSVATIDLVKEADGTRLTYTEQGAYLDELDMPQMRQEGTAEMLDGLVKYLSS
ncbi:MAG TPA: SRPBCC family protein [Streptosporangiaceae bacterium]|jgi:uncharacterized protein YndB with AHSA1/START domain